MLLSHKILDCHLLEKSEELAVLDLYSPQHQLAVARQWLPFGGYMWPLVFPQSPHSLSLPSSGNEAKVVASFSVLAWLLSEMRNDSLYPYFYNQ